MGSIAHRVFTGADQTAFAALSGDWNPMHVDAVAARRVGAGAQVVHGVHNLLWCLDSVAGAFADLGAMSSLRVNFDSFVTVGESVELAVLSRDAARLRLEVRVRGIVALTALVGFGESTQAAREKPATVVDPDTVRDVALDGLAGQCGKIPFAGGAAAFSDYFPHAARVFGARTLAALGAFTRLVGMVCPGLHSIFNKIALKAGGDDGADDIGFRVDDVHLEHRRVSCAVWGGGWTGTLTTTMRHPPTVQPSMADIARRVGKNESRHSVALVVGGSRGIGEVVAKMIAAGGGTPIITYASGRDDALRVADDIIQWGGACTVMRLDVTMPVREQLADLADVPNALYYFATPMIGGRKMQLFEPARLDAFIRFYVSGFYDCCRALLDRGSPGLAALYPSSVFVDERPAGVTEYAMAKAAGEALCHDMGGIAGLRIIVSRLPRLATDQNPGLSGSLDGLAIEEAMLPLVREVCAASAVLP